MTKREMFNEILNVPAVAENEEMKNFILHELELLERKSTSKKPTKTQLENERLRGIIMVHLTEVDTMKSISELQTEIAELEKLSNQKMTHLLSPLVKEGKLKKEYIKKVPHYFIAH